MLMEKRDHALETPSDESPHVAPDINEEETDAVLLDVGAAKLENGDYGSLKLARDGHVCRSAISILTQICNSNLVADCPRTAAIERSK